MSRYLASPAQINPPSENCLRKVLTFKSREGVSAHFQCTTENPWENRMPSDLARGMQYSLYSMGTEMYFRASRTARPVRTTQALFQLETLVLISCEVPSQLSVDLGGQHLQPLLI